MEKKLELKTDKETTSLSKRPADFDVDQTYKTAMQTLLKAIGSPSVCTLNSDRVSHSNLDGMLDSLPMLYLTEGIKTTALMLACKPS
jgi:hypothetical protein